MIIAVIAFVILIILAAVLFSKEEKWLPSKEQEVFEAAQKFSTQYLNGHPAIKAEEYVYLVKDANGINIVERKLYQDSPPHIIVATIPYKAVTSIEAGDGSHVEKKFSLGRFLVIGVYAFAWLKKQPKETGFLIINWKEAGTEYATIFKNEEKGALKDIAIARNAILHWIQQNKATIS